MIPEELRYALIKGWARLIYSTVNFTVPPGSYEVEIGPDPDYCRIVVELSTEPPEPAGPTTDFYVKSIHSYGVGIERTTEYIVYARHSLVDHPHATYFSLIRDYPMYLIIGNNTGETQNFSYTYTYVAFPNKNDFDTWKSWWETKNNIGSKLEELLEQVKGLRTLLERLRR